jgi:hypothetical protein
MNTIKHPLWLSLLNNSWEISYPLGTKIRIEKDELIKAARKKTGLNDLGKEFDDEPLSRLLRSVNEEARLNPVGRFITRQRFVSLLSMRLRAEYYFHRYPEILEQELYPAWIILGLQRTGTTKIQRLLATDPEHRWLPSWEVINPLPLDQRDGARDKRIGMAKTAVTALKFLSPGFFAIHPIDIHQPEEDILLLDISFMSTTPEAMMHVPSYAKWLEQTDQSAAYEYMVRLLKFLQWEHPSKRWILKTPHHLEFPELITKYFGKVNFIWTHRSIYESIPSFLSMVMYNRMIFSNEVSGKEIADHWVRKTGYMLDRAIEFRKKEGHEKLFMDIGYPDLIEDTFKELSRIYAMNDGISPEKKARFEQHEKEHPPRKFGVHRYSLDDFNITKADIDHHTMHYQEFVSGMKLSFR